MGDAEGIVSGLARKAAVPSRLRALACHVELECAPDDSAFRFMRGIEDCDGAGDRTRGELREAHACLCGMSRSQELPNRCSSVDVGNFFGGTNPRGRLLNVTKRT